MSITILLVLHALFLTTQGASINVRPRPLIVATEGESFNITCEGTSDNKEELIRLKQLYPNGGSKNIFTSSANSSQKQDNYSLMKLGYLNYTVIDENATFNDARPYRCTFVHDDAVYRDTKVAVIKRPLLTINETLYEGGTTWLMCEVEYKVPDGVEGANDFLRVFSVTFGGKKQDGDMTRSNGYRRLKWRYDLSASDDGKVMTCSACTKMNYCVNTTERLSVQYSVREPTITPRRSEYHVGEEVTCTARGNPPPTTYWRRLDAQGKTKHLTKLILSKDMEGQRWECVARNKVADIGVKKDRTGITFNVISAKILKAGSVRMEGLLFVPTLFAVLLYSYMWE